MSLKKTAVAVAAAAVMLAGAACSAATQNTGQNTGQAAATAAGPAQNGGTLVVAQAYDPDPASFLKTAVGNIVTEYAVFETLTLIDAQTGEPKGVLAKSWKLAPDGKSMTVQLRDDVTFHSGRKLTAADVAFTVDKAKEPAVGAANQKIAAQISAVQVKSDTELSLTFANPLPAIFDLFETMPILNKDTYADYAAGQKVDGTGRFEWKSFTPGGKVELTKYAKYRDAVNTHLDAIEVNIVKDPTALVSAIKSGRAQYAVGVAPVDARSLGTQQGFALLSSGGAAFHLGLNVTKPPFDNKSVRQAVQYAIDRNRIVQQAEGGKATAASLPWRPSTVGYDSAQSGHYTYDPAKAKQMLTDAGVKPGTTFDVATADGPESLAIFQIVKNNLAAVGLEAKPVTMNVPDYQQKLAARTFPTAAVLMQASNGASPATAMVSRPELSAEQNITFFKTPEYSALSRTVTNASTKAAQEKALKEFDDYFLDQAFAVALITRPTLTVRSSSLNNIVATQMGFLNLGQSWLSD
ncbi:ABC transporter substrate-binding protein [Kribbella speibonae]|uniref:ABC transporter substrate-binding protein n=1 Tax=Kribbella speibonae TaxID=1572660 RepID=A0A4R0ICS9_9ACTN|nr:ABC transporter substrate-binding protein [Kribbella speibonae]TCC28966.1 ABC transporter substrate-binding protein [Kribbella speibonae]